jgi:hypothetical protein
MPVKIVHPSKLVVQTIKQNLVIIQGLCDDSNKVIGTLTHLATQQTVPNGQLLKNHKNRWGFCYRNLLNGIYSFRIDQTNSPVVTSSELVAFEVNVAPPPPPPAPPLVTAPGPGDQVAAVFYPYGTTGQAITAIQFYDDTHSQAGTITQSMDPDGNWTGQVDGIDNWPNGSGNNYSLDVSNPATTTVAPLSIATS